MLEYHTAEPTSTALSTKIWLRVVCVRLDKVAESCSAADGRFASSCSLSEAPAGASARWFFSGRHSWALKLGRFARKR